MKSKIMELKQEHLTKIEYLNEEIERHIAKYGSNACDYLLSRQMHRTYHTGALNALIELGKRLGK
jgi:hypothetical protein